MERGRRKRRRVEREKNVVMMLEDPGRQGQHCVL